MKKKLIKFLITVSILLTTFNTNILAQKNISGEKLEKLLTENHIIIYDFFGPLRNNIELNFDAGSKTYSLNGFFPLHQYVVHPRSGTWELVGFGKSSVRLDDIQNQNQYTNQNARIQLFFGDDGNIYNLNQKLYSYRLENKKERIENNARRIKEERIAEELRLKKIEEEKRQLAIKREQERIKQEQKQEEEKKRFQAEYELALKKDKERREEEERKELHKNILKYSLITIFFSILSFVVYKYRARIKDEFYPKFIKYLKNIKSNKKEFYPKLIGYIKDIQTNSDKKLGLTIMGVFFVVIVLIVISLSGNKSSTSNQNYSTSNEISDEKFRRYVELRTAIKRECDNKWYTRGLSTIAADVERMCRNNMYDVHSKTFIGETSEVKRRLRDYGVYE
jgi:hypothetical protein